MQERIIVIASKKVIRFLSTSILFNDKKVEYYDRDLKISIDLNNIELLIDLTCFDINDYDIHYHNTSVVPRILGLSKKLGFKYVFGYQKNLFPEEAIYVNYSLKSIRDVNDEYRLSNVVLEISDLIGHSEYISSFIDFILNINENSTYIVVNNLQNDIELASVEDLGALITYLVKNHRNIHITEITLKPDKSISKLSFLNYFIFRQKNLVNIQNGTDNSRESYKLLNYPLIWDVVNTVDADLSKFISNQIGKNVSYKDLNNSQKLARKELEAILGLDEDEIKVNKEKAASERDNAIEALSTTSDFSYKPIFEQTTSTDLKIKLNNFDRDFDKQQEVEKLEKLTAKALLNIDLEEEQLNLDTDAKLKRSKKNLKKVLQYILLASMSIFIFNEVFFLFQYISLTSDLNKIERHLSAFNFARGIVDSKTSINHANNAIRVSDRAVFSKLIAENLIGADFTNNILDYRTDFENYSDLFEILSILQNSQSNTDVLKLEENSLLEIDKYLDSLLLNISDPKNIDNDNIFTKLTINNLKVLFANWNDLTGYNGKFRLLVIDKNNDAESSWEGNFDQFAVIDIDKGIFSLNSVKSAADIDSFINENNGIIGSKEYREELRSTYVSTNNIDWYMNGNELIGNMAKLYDSVFGIKIDGILILDDNSKLTAEILGKTNNLENTDGYNDFINILNSKNNTLIYKLVQKILYDLMHSKSYLLLNDENYLNRSSWINNREIIESDLYINTYTNDKSNLLSKQVDLFIEGNTRNLVIELANKSSEESIKLVSRMVMPKNIKLKKWDITKDSQTASILQNIHVYVYNTEKLIISNDLELLPESSVIYTLTIEDSENDFDEMNINFDNEKSYDFNIYANKDILEKVKTNLSTVKLRQIDN